RFRDQRDRSDRPLDGVEHRQAGEHAHRRVLLRIVERGPALDVVRDGYLFWQPEVGRQSIPYLAVTVIRNLVPVNGTDDIPRLVPRRGLRGPSRRKRAFSSSDLGGVPNFPTADLHV